MKKHTLPQKAIRIVIATSDPNLQIDLKEKIEFDPSFKVIASCSRDVYVTVDGKVIEKM